MKKTIIFTFMLGLFLINTALQSQPKMLSGIIKGVVLDQTTLTPIINANVTVITTDLGAATDISGKFKIIGLKPGTYHLRASVLGYLGNVRSEVTVSPGKTTTIEFLLEPTAISNKEVTVKSGFFFTKPDLITSNRSLGFEEIRRAPGAAEDVQRVIQALPGVTSSNDQNNEILARGGSPSENLLVMDGIEIDNINHFPDQSNSGGPIGLVNPEFLKEITFASGGYSAKFGDKLSSVLDLELREGDREQFQGQMMLSMAGVGANIEGGLFDGKGSYLVSYRKSYLDLINEAVGLTAIPHYYDFQVKTVYDVSPTNKLSLIGLYGNDQISIKAEDGDAWSRGAESVDAKGHTLVFGGKWRKIWSKGYSNLIFGHTEHYFNQQVFEVDKDEVTDNISRRMIWENASREITDQLHFNWSGKSRQTDEYSAGITLKPITFSHDIWLERDTTVYDDYTGDLLPDTVFHDERMIDESTTSLKYGAYIQYRWKPYSELTLVGGIRMDGFQYSEEITLAPRFSLSWKMYPQWTLNAAFGHYYQSHPLMVYTNDPDGGNQLLPHARADQYVLGLSYLIRESTQLSLEGYYKDYQNLAVSLQSLRDDDDMRPRTWLYHSVGRKWSWGLECFFQQKLADNWYGTISYSYSVTRFDDSETTYPSSYDYRNIATAVIGYIFSGLPVREFQKHWFGWWSSILPIGGDEMTLSTRFRYVSGRPFTSREYTSDGPEYDEHWRDISETNMNRYPAYNRWDIRLDNKWFIGSKSIISFVEAQNILDRKNIAQYIYADDGERDDVEQFRFFFVGGFRFEW